MVGTEKPSPPLSLGEKKPASSPVLDPSQIKSILLDTKKSLDGRRKAYKEFSQIDIDERVLNNLDLQNGDKVLDMGTGQTSPTVRTFAG